MPTQYQSTRAERQRLNRILTHEEYGPALVRLTKREQREILDLVSANQSQVARRRIVELDAARRRRVAERSAARRAADLSGGRRALLNRAARAMEPVAGEPPWSLARWKREADRRATMGDLKIVASSTPEEIRWQASRDAYRAKYHALHYSPFWYH